MHPLIDGQNLIHESQNFIFESRHSKLFSNKRDLTQIQMVYFNVAYNTVCIDWTQSPFTPVTTSVAREAGDSERLSTVPPHIIDALAGRQTYG